MQVLGVLVESIQQCHVLQFWDSNNRVANHGRNRLITFSSQAMYGNQTISVLPGCSTKHKPHLTKDSSRSSTSLVTILGNARAGAEVV